MSIKYSFLCYNKEVNNTGHVKCQHDAQRRLWCACPCHYPEWRKAVTGRLESITNTKTSPTLEELKRVSEDIDTVQLFGSEAIKQLKRKGLLK